VEVARLLRPKALVATGLPPQASRAELGPLLGPLLVGLRGGEPDEGAELVPGQTGRGVGLGDPGEALEGVGHSDPLPGGAPGQAITSRQPGGHGSGPVPAPQLQLVALGYPPEGLGGGGRQQRRGLV
jgi:hypothetical protein